MYFIQGHGIHGHGHPEQFKTGLAAIEHEIQVAQDEFDIAKFEIARAKTFALLNQVEEYATRRIGESATRIRSRAFERTMLYA